MAAKQIKIGIVGAASLSASKLLEILLRHPHAKVEVCVSESSPGEPVVKSHPQLRGRIDLPFEGLDIERLAQCDVVFSCKRPGESFAFIPKLVEKGCRVIDLSGDFRLKREALFKEWYGVTHEHPVLLENAVYGLPEWHREEIRKAKLISNPGCYTTTSILACAPLVAEGLVEAAPIIINAISGVSGAGRGAKSENLFIHVAENVRAYRVGNHQHTPEIEQEIGLAAARQGRDAANVTVLFVPHVGPYRNGIMADCYLRPAGDVSDETLRAAFAKYYENEPFVRVYEPGQMPQVDYVAGTNFCDIGFRYDKRTNTVVVVSVTDNLVKGAAGQAVQNMNLMFGLDERTALA